MNKRIIFGMFLLFLSINVHCQVNNDSMQVNRTRISVLGGLPRIAGFQGEYVLPAANNHFALKADASFLPNIFPESKTVTRYTGIGVNAYAQKNASGPYLGLSYGSLFIRAEEIENDPVDLDVRFNWISSQVGIKAGKRLFFVLNLVTHLSFMT